MCGWQSVLPVLGFSSILSSFLSSFLAVFLSSFPLSAFPWSSGSNFLGPSSLSILLGEGSLPSSAAFYLPLLPLLVSPSLVSLAGGLQFLFCSPGVQDSPHSDLRLRQASWFIESLSIFIDSHICLSNAVWGVNNTLINTHCSSPSLSS